MQELSTTVAALEVHRRINRTARPYPDQSTVNELFERCAKEFSDGTAIVCGSESLTYRELNRLANGLAARLLDIGVTSGQRVAVYSERSVEMIVSLLAITKCGASYLPVDPSWPDSLLQAIMSSFGCRLVLVGNGAAIAVRPHENCRAVPVDISRLESLDVIPHTEADPAAIAYINFTSGTTGTPKGVPIQHRSIARLVFDPVYAPLSHTSVLLQMSPVTFDAATFEIWGALLRGGTCVLYPYRMLSFSKLSAVIERGGVTVAFITTALLNAIIDEAPATLDTVSTILTGGERYSHRHIAAALERYGQGRLVHVYGPTECTTFATYYPIDRMPDERDKLPIGMPIQNTRLYVVSGKSLCPPGVIGEIMLAGPGLSPGYLGADQTGAASFAEYAIHDVAERVYRTGDFGYLLDSGELVFAGRRDDQVKINGFRVKLAELSQTLDDHPNIKQSYVTVSQWETGERVLCAFVVPLYGQMRAAELRNYIRLRLPAYMVPSIVNFYERLPLTATGKVDRQALLREVHATSLIPPAVDEMADEGRLAGERTTGGRSI